MMLRLRLLTTHIGDLKMRNPTTTPYNMLQASLECLKKTCNEHSKLLPCR